MWSVNAPLWPLYIPVIILIVAGIYLYCKNLELNEAQNRMLRVLLTAQATERSKIEAEKYWGKKFSEGRADGLSYATMIIKGIIEERY